jgi:threonine/homoserine/homoserine lactone efflux protein
MIIEFLLTAIIIELTPGPNMFWLAFLSVSRGRIIAFIAITGVTLGLCFAAMASIFGVDALITTEPWIFQILRFAGFFYLLYLAWDSLRVSNKTQNEKFTESFSRYFSQGLLSNMLNPKAYLVYATIIPQFADSSQSLFKQLSVLSILYISVATIIHVTIALLAGNFTKFFASHNRIKLLGRVFATLLVLVALWFLYATKMKL